jgi:hypothetical protein
MPTFCWRAETPSGIENVLVKLLDYKPLGRPAARLYFLFK